MVSAGVEACLKWECPGRGITEPSNHHKGGEGSQRDQGTLPQKEQQISWSCSGWGYLRGLQDISSGFIGEPRELLGHKFNGRHS